MGDCMGVGFENVSRDHQGQIGVLGGNCCSDALPPKRRKPSPEESPDKQAKRKTLRLKTNTSVGGDLGEICWWVGSRSETFEGQSSGDYGLRTCREKGSFAWEGVEWPGVFEPVAPIMHQKDMEYSRPVCTRNSCD